MNRRGMIQAALAALASIPGAGWIASAKARPHRVNLAAVRDLLMPNLRMRNGDAPDLELRIQIDYTTENLLVIGRDDSLRRELGFALTRESIVDRRYIAEFNPSVTDLIRCLRLDIAEYDRTFGGGGYVQIEGLS